MSNEDSLFKQQYSSCYAQIEQGLSHDEKGNYHLALQHYTRALRIINSCLSSSAHHHSHDLQWVDKMKKYRDMFAPRIQELQQKCKQQQIQDNVTSVQQQQHQAPPQPQSINNSNAGGFFSSLWTMFGGSQPNGTTTTTTTNATVPSSHSPPTPSLVSQHTVQSPHGYPVASSSRLQQMQNPLHRSSNFAMQQQPVSDTPNISSSSRTDHAARKSSGQPENQKQQQSKNNNNNNENGNAAVNRNPKKLAVDKIPELRGVDKKLLDHILNEVVQNTDQVIQWDDIAGLKDAKQILHETIVLPSLRPDIFQGLRAPARGVLLFGPPGNGKTLLAKAVSSQCKSTFFSISASSLVSKWHGEGEKLVKALFAAANYLAPSVIFIDEIDSILTSRSTNEHEASRRLKTEFLIQLDGVSANLSSQNRILVMGATNRPYELDDAILRRFTKRIYIPLPDAEARTGLIKNALGSQRTKLSSHDYTSIAKLTQGYSGSDLKALCQEASMVAIREMGSKELLTISPEQLRPLCLDDFVQSVKRVKPSVSTDNIQDLVQWNKQFGTFS